MDTKRITQDEHVIFIEETECQDDFPITFVQDPSRRAIPPEAQKETEDSFESSEYSLRSEEPHNIVYSDDQSFDDSYYTSESFYSSEYDEDEYDDDYDNEDELYSDNFYLEYPEEYQESDYYSSTIDGSIEDLQSFEFEVDNEYTSSEEENLSGSEISIERTENTGDVINIIPSDSVTEEPELVILESLNLNNMFPNVTNYLVMVILSRLYMAYDLSFEDCQPNTYPYSDVRVADILRGFTEEEMNFLKLKVTTVLTNNIEMHNSNLVQRLVDLISVDTIDTINKESLKRRKLTSTCFKDLLNVESSICGICYGDFKPLHKCISLRCMHTFHAKCINRWVSSTWCCPLCRETAIG